MKTFTLLLATFVAVCLNNNYAQNTWTNKAKFGGERIWHAVGFSIGGKGYIGMGGDHNGYRKDFWEYDPATDAWTQKADFGGGDRLDAVGFSIGSKGYTGTGNSHGVDTKDFWEYDPAANSWTRKADFGGLGREMAVGFSMDSKGYIGTGEDFFGGGGETKDFWEYDPATNAWTQKADFGGEDRVGATGFSISSKGYIGTGYGGGFLKNDFWEYDPATNTWTQKADFGGSGRAYDVGFSVGKKGYIGTGQVVNGIKLQDFWEYDPATNGWTQKADFAGGLRSNAVGFSIGNKGYIGTGNDGQVLYKDFREYTPDNGCPSPSNLRAQKISDISAVLKWQVAGADILHVQVRYRAAGVTAWTKKNKNGVDTSIHINGLSPSTTYEWQLRIFCAADTTAWVKGPDFTTAASLNSGTKATVYPNPAGNTVTVNYSATRNGKYIIEITNASGNVVLRKEANATPGANRITLDMSRFFKGVYFINIIRPDMTRERMQLSKE